MQALLSVFDKTGLLELAQGLLAQGVRLFSTGGTARMLERAGLAVVEVAQTTGFPEMLDGRVKTLHPVVHGGLLARRDKPEHMAALEAHGIASIDFLVVNLYPFESTVAQADCTLEQAIENIDIGGPAMVRSAAKNWRDVVVLTDPTQYMTVLTALQERGSVGLKTRFALAQAAFNCISNYDAAISDYLSSIDLAQEAPLPTSVPVRKTFADQANGRFIKLQDLRYGENPHQQAAFYRDLYPAPGSLVTAQQLQGKALSYNNIADADAAWECVKRFTSAACVIVKHANPCGVALGEDACSAYKKALQTDPASAFGGIIALNCTVNLLAAQAVSKQFIEVLVAPSFSTDALAWLTQKASLRVLQTALPSSDKNGKDDTTPWEGGLNALDIKRVGSGLLMQTADNHRLQASDLTVVSKTQPTPEQLQDLHFAWQVAGFVKSNAIVFCAGAMTLGVGAGQMSRLDSVRIAEIKARHAGLPLVGSAVASDAFFPFRDGLDALAKAGAACVIQPGGSMRDQEVIDAANEHGLVMVFTGVRHFRH